MAERTCTIDDCGRGASARGMCSIHYQRWRKHGDPRLVLKVHRHRPVEPCSVAGCEHPAYCKRLCDLHYKRLMSTGDTGPLGLVNPLRDRSDVDRFWAKVDRRGPDDCWPWTEGADEDGYGLFKAGGRMHRACRWLLARKIGRPLAADEVTRHTCDNPPCVNPAHLIPGSPRDNLHDARDRGRLIQGDKHWTRRAPERLHGEGNPAAKLTADQVREIRDLYASGARQVDLAEDYGIAQPYVSQIVRRKSWTHI